MSGGSGMIPTFVGHVPATRRNQAASVSPPNFGQFSCAGSVGLVARRGASPVGGSAGKSCLAGSHGHRAATTAGLTRAAAGLTGSGTTTAERTRQAGITGRGPSARAAAAGLPHRAARLARARAAVAGRRAGQSRVAGAAKAAAAATGLVGRTARGAGAARTHRGARALPSGLANRSRTTGAAHRAAIHAGSRHAAAGIGASQPGGAGVIGAADLAAAPTRLAARGTHSPAVDARLTRKAGLTTVGVPTATTNGALAPAGDAGRARAPGAGRGAGRKSASASVDGTTAASLVDGTACHASPILAGARRAGSLGPVPTAG